MCNERHTATSGCASATNGKRGVAGEMKGGQRTELLRPDSVDVSQQVPAQNVVAQLCGLDLKLF